MNPALRNVALVALGVGLAAVGYLVWQQLFSREAEIERIHRACLAEIEAGSARMKSELDRIPGSRSQHPAATLGKSLGEGLGKLLDSMSGNVGEKVCGAIQDACRGDFEGRVCQAARERYP